MKIYGRCVTKKEAKLLKKTQVLYPAEDHELVPAFDATDVLDVLGTLKRDEIKQLHILLGGSGAASMICLFKALEEPFVKDVPLRRADEVRKLLGKWVKEVKFRPGTRIELVGCFKS